MGQNRNKCCVYLTSKTLKPPFSLSLSLLYSKIHANYFKNEVSLNPNVLILLFSPPRSYSSGAVFFCLQILVMQPHNFPKPLFRHSKICNLFIQILISFNPKPWSAYGGGSTVVGRRDSRDHRPHVRRQNHRASSQDSVREQQWQVCVLLLICFLCCAVDF
jgi:hypothetical protein